MKKVVRYVWISLLTGIAFLVACTTQGRLSRSERKQLIKERDSIEANLKSAVKPSDKELKELMNYKQWEVSQQLRLQDINQLLLDKEALLENQTAIERINGEIKTLAKIIEESIPAPVYGPPSELDSNSLKQERLLRLKEKRKAILNTIKEMEGARVYGSPEVMSQRRTKKEELRKQLNEVEEELKDLQ